MNHNIKFLFFIEREFHLALLLPLINYIKIHQIGQLAIYSTEHYSSQISVSNYGLRPDIIREYIDFEIEVVNNPYKYQPDITFMADFSYHYTEGLGKIVNIGHGTISKGWYYTDRVISCRENCADLICVPGTIHKEILKKRVYKPISVTGMPKLDRLFSGLIDKKAILNEMNLSIENKTVLLAPTFNQEFTILNYLIEDIRYYIPDYLNVVIKLHGVASEASKKHYRTMANNHKNVYYTENYDISDCIAVSDLLITDMSSVIYEFLSTYKPVLLYDSPQQKDYVNFQPDDIEYLYRNIGLRFDDVKKIPELIFRALTNYQISNENKTIADGFISVRDGNSSKRVIEDAMTLLNDQNVESRIILKNSNQENSNTIIKKLNSKSTISCFPQNGAELVQNTLNDLNSLKDIFIQLSDINEDFIFYHDSNYLLSPCSTSFLINHLKTDPSIGLIVPLIYNDEINYQQARLRVVNQDNTNLDVLSVQITYSFAGQSLQIPFAEPVSFMFRKQDLLDFKDQSENELSSWYDLLSYILGKKKNIHLAFDVMVYPGKKESKSKYSIIPETVNQDIFSDSDIDSLKKHILNNPFDNEAIFSLVEKLYQENDWDGIDVYGNLIKNDSKVYWYLIRSLEEQKNLESAYALFDEIIINNLEEFNWKSKLFALKAKLQIKLEKTEDTYSLITKAIECDPNEKEAWLTQGAFAMMKTDLSLSEESFKKVLSLDKNNKTALLGIALLNQFQNNHLQAIDFFEKLLIINEEDMEALNGIVKSSWQINSFENAITALLNYLEYHPADLNILFTLSGIYYETNQFEKALKNIETILLLNPEFNDAQLLKDKINYHL